MVTRKLYNFRAALPEIAAALDAADNKSGLINTALKAYLTRSTAPPPELLALWRQAARDVSGMATNCNQLARAAHLSAFNGRELTAAHFEGYAADHKELRERLFGLLRFWEA